MRSDNPRFINKWSWLEHDAKGNPIFTDDPIIFGEYIKDTIIWQPPERQREAEYPRAPGLLVWLLFMALGVLLGCAAVELARLF